MRALTCSPLTWRLAESSGERGNLGLAAQDFLALWKDADPDISILKQAKAEYDTELSWRL